MFSPMPTMLTRAISRACGASGRQRLNILTYHRVLPAADAFRPAEPTPEIFEWQMALLAQHYTPLSLDDALRGLDEGSLPDRAVCVTFDDGYADNVTVALPILQRWGIPATVFVSTGFLNGGRMWNDTVIEAMRNYQGDTIDLNDADLGVLATHDSGARLRSLRKIIRSIKHRNPSQRALAVKLLRQKVTDLPDNLMMSDEQVRDMAKAGVEIGAHTCTHPILTTLNDETCREEISQSRSILENLIDKPVRYFAYPNGKRGQDYERRERDYVKNEGFKSALATNWGVCHSTSDRWQLPRFTPWDKTPLRFHLRLLMNYRHPG